MTIYFPLPHISFWQKSWIFFSYSKMILHNRSHVDTDSMPCYNMKPQLWIQIALATVGVDGFRKHQKPSLLNLNWVALSQNFRFGKNHWDPLDNIEKNNYLVVGHAWEISTFWSNLNPKETLFFKSFFICWQKYF